MKPRSTLKKESRVVRSFLPIASPRALVLILGSMPGEESLRKQQYYAHPRNAFWPIMERFFDVDSSASYAQRTALLRKQRIALWDVLGACERRGSLDTAISKSTEIPNDIERLIAQCKGLRAIFFNGAKAEQTFQRKVFPEIKTLLEGIHLERLPSTSPAHASLSFDEKCEIWKRVLQWL